MRGKPFPGIHRVIRAGAPAVAALALLCCHTPAPAQTEGPPAELPRPDPAVVQAGCSTCGSGLLGAPSGHGGCASCGDGCYPGRNNDYCCCDCEGWFGRVFCSLYECVCCPDPCYEPRWLPVADSAFFLDAARPVTQMRLRWDSAFDVKHPDRAEYFWPRQRTDPSQLGGGIGKGPTGIARTVDYQELSLYTEAAAGAFGLSVEVPYRHLEPEPSGLPAGTVKGASGFADMNIATKAMLIDCELLQLTFQFKTFIPTGNFTRGLGTGHVSLEPSLLFNIKLTPDWYVQGQLAYWIPLGGDPGYQGNIFHSHLSLNHILARPIPGLVFVGVLEFNEWSVLGGQYTASDFLVISGGRPTPVAVDAESTVFSMGPGIRMFCCDKVDIGVGTAFAFTGARWAEEIIRAEFRWRF
jgi:hypothetical protein